MKLIEASRRIRVLHIVGGMNRGGVETWLMHVLHHIDRKRFQLDFMVHTTAPCSYDSEVRSLGGQIFPCLHPNRPWHYARNFRGAVGAYGPYDIVHSHVHHYSGYTLCLAQHAGIPIRIAHSHNDASPQDISPSPLRWIYLTMTERLIRRYATISLAASGKAAEALFGREWQRSSLCRLLYYGIDLEPFRAKADPFARAALQLPADAFVIGHVGRFDEQKNHRFLLEIFRHVAHDDPRSRLMLIGDGPLRPAIERRVAELGLTGRVVFTGIRADVPRLLLNVFNMFVMPSLYEGLGLVCLEAQAAGVQCLLASTIPNEAAVVPQLVTRLQLSQPATTWATAVLDSRDRAREITQAEALALVEKSPFDIRRSVVELARLYQTAITLSQMRSGDFRRNAGDLRIQHAVDQPLRSGVPKTL
jgi:glycosyltransferase involved in cell wall biosynthesis